MFLFLTNILVDFDMEEHFLSKSNPSQHDQYTTLCQLLANQKLEENHDESILFKRLVYTIDRLHLKCHLGQSLSRFSHCCPSLSV